MSLQTSLLSAVSEARADLAARSVIVATGLVVLVDYCIRHHWPAQPPSAPLAPVRPRVTADAGRARSAVRGFFSRTPSPGHSRSPLRAAKAVVVH